LAKDHLAASHLRINVGRVGSSHANIEQQVIWVDNSMKKQALCDLLYSLDPGRTIIFVNNKRLADELDDFLFHKEMPCTSMHADRTQREREDAMRAFRNGKTPILVATGVTARGIDVRNVKYVINYDLPSVDHGGITEYTHRIGKFAEENNICLNYSNHISGRTARAGLKGKAFSFYTDRDEPLAELLTKTLLETRQEIPEFLQGYVPENANVDQLKFEPDSDEEVEGEDAGGWGAGNDDAGGWGGDTTNAGDSTGWGADNNTNGGDSTGWGAGNDASGWGGDAPTSAPINW
jgi:ATP-dependent RNA helicase DDX3X